MIDSGQLEYEPVNYRWYRAVPDSRLVTDTIAWDATLSAEQIENILGKFTRTDGLRTSYSTFDELGNQFCLEQDDSEAEMESDEALPEFLDTFEVKEGD